MAPEKAPAFQWYPKDYLTDPVVVAMSLEAEGAYRRLMDYCWLKGSLPHEMSQLVPLAKARNTKHLERLWAEFGCKFEEVDGPRWVHPRLDEERRKQSESKERRQAAAEKRWAEERAKRDALEMQNTHDETCNADALQCSPSSSPSSSPTPVSTCTRASVPDALHVRFDRFWAAYPKKVGKGAALKAWVKLHPSEALTNTILTAVEAQSRSPQWTKDGGQYIPNPATWLNQGRWEDEVGISTPPPEPTWRKRCADPESLEYHQGECCSLQAHEQRIVLDARVKRARGEAA